MIYKKLCVMLGGGVIYAISMHSLLVFADELPLEISVVNPISSDYILDKRFEKNKRSLNINIKAATGEYEPFSFIIHSHTDMTNLTVNVTGLSFQKHSIPENNIDVKWVKYWYQSNGAWKTHRAISPKKEVLVPELLLNDDSLLKVDHVKHQNYLNVRSNSSRMFIPLNAVDYKRGIDAPEVNEFDFSDSKKIMPVSLKKDSYKQVWVTVRVPDDASPGTYHGTVNVQNKGAVIIRIPVTLEVFGFRLNESMIEYSIYYRGVLADTEGTISSENKSRVQLKKELLNMREHGITNPTLYQPLKPMSLLEEYLKLRLEAGFANDSLYYLGVLTGNSKNITAINTLRNNIRSIRKVALKYGFKNVFVYGKDESKGIELIKQKTAWNLVHEEGAKVLAAGYKGHFDSMQGLTDILVQHGEPSIDEARKHHAKGKKIYSYSNPQVGVENPLVYRRNFGIGLWQFEFDGAMDYAYQHSMGFIWNDFDHKYYRDLVFAYPTSDGVIDTIAWEGFREGVDDVRYLSTLLTIKQKLHPVLDCQLIDIISDYIEKLKRNLKFDPVQVRLEIIDLILQVCAANKHYCTQANE